MTSSVSHLSRLCRRAISLPKLGQGSTLTIKSSRALPLNVTVIPGWREDGHLTLEQQIPGQGQAPSDHTISTQQQQHEADMFIETSVQGTSMGRQETHISILVDWKTELSRRLDTRYSEDSNEKRKAKLDHDDTTSMPVQKAPKLSMEYCENIATKTNTHDVHKAEYNEDFSLSTISDHHHHHSQPPPLHASPILLTALVPEKLNLTCNLEGGGDISVTKKLEGDAHLHTMTICDDDDDDDYCNDASKTAKCGGNIKVSKLRGHIVSISTTADTAGSKVNSGSIYCSDLLEAQHVSLKVVDNGRRGGGGVRGRIRAKRIHGSNVNIQVLSPSKDDLAEKTNFDNTSDKKSSPSGDDEVTTAERFDKDDSGAVIDIGSLYATGVGEAALIVDSSSMTPHRGAARVKSNHGHLTVCSTTQEMTTELDEITNEQIPLVDLGGVNGSCDISIVSTSSAAIENKSIAVAAKVHVDSVSPDSVSVISTNTCGQIKLSLDRKVETDLRLFSSPDVERFDVESLLGDDDDDDDGKQDILIPTSVLEHDAAFQLASLKKNYDTTPFDDRISIRTNAFTHRHLKHPLKSGTKTSPLRNVSYVDGWVENKSHEPDSRFDVKMDVGARGKIRLEGAAAQALRRFGPANESYSSSGHKKYHLGEPPTAKGGEGDAYLARRPLFLVATAGHVMVETLSWFGAIARRYGIEEKKRDVGRQATASREAMRYSRNNDSKNRKR